MANSDLSNAIAGVVHDFCGDDRGRSLSVRVAAPVSAEAGRRSDTPRPAASVIKLALAMTALDLSDAGQFDLDHRLPITIFPPTRYCSILAAFDETSTLTAAEVLKLAIITSDNPLAVWLTEIVGRRRVNQLLSSLGCSRNAAMGAGFTEAELGPLNRSNILTANDALRLLEVIDDRTTFAPLRTAMVNNLRNDRMPALLDEDVQIAHKTGSLEGVVNDIGTLRRGGTLVHAAFLTEDQSDPIRTAHDIAEATRRIFTLAETAG